MGDSTAFILKVVGAVAGLGGIGLGLFTVLFKELIRKEIFPKLNREQSYQVILRFMTLTFTIGVLGLSAWVVLSIYKPESEQILQNGILTNKLESVISDLDSLQKEYQSIEDKLLKTKFPGLEVLERELHIDLTEHSFVQKELRNTQKVSPAYWNINVKAVKVWKETRFYSTAFGFTGIEPNFSSKSHQFVASVNDDPMPRGTENLKRWILDFDISEELEYRPFEIKHSATFWNSFQGRTNEWAAAAVYYPLKLLTIKVTLPKGRKFSEIEPKEYPIGSDEPREIYPLPDTIISPLRTEIVWKIKDPKLSHYYRINWKW